MGADTKGGKHPTSDTFDNFHTYTIDWKEDVLNWLIDGVVVRTVKKADTYDKETKAYHYQVSRGRQGLARILRCL